MKFIDKFKTNNCQTTSTIPTGSANAHYRTDDAAGKHDVEITPAMKQVLDKLFGGTNGGKVNEKSNNLWATDAHARTERNSPSHSPGHPRGKKQRFSEKHQVYANPRADDVPLIERQRSYINYARQRLQLDKIDHKKLSNSAILKMNFPRRNKQFVSDSSTNITEQTLNALQNSSFQLSPQLSPSLSGNMRYGD